MFIQDTRVSRLGVVFIVGWLMACGSSAEATTFVKFYTDAGNTHGYGNANDDFSGAGTLYSDMTTPGSGATATPTACPSSGSCTSAGGDNIQTTLTFTGFVASANTGMKVWDDLAPNFGGLGVGTGSSGTDTNDQINGTNILTLTFTSPITLTGVATLFDGAHTPFGNGDPLSNTSGFFLLNGNAVSFSNANNNLLNLTEPCSRLKRMARPIRSFICRVLPIHLQPHFPPRSRSSPPASVQWVCLVGAGSGRALLSRPDQNT